MDKSDDEVRRNDQQQSDQRIEESGFCFCRVFTGRSCKDPHQAGNDDSYRDDGADKHGCGKNDILDEESDRGRITCISYALSDAKCIVDVEFALAVEEAFWTDSHSLDILIFGKSS